MTLTISLRPPTAAHIENLLATSPFDDNRISYGCVNVPATFFDEIVQPAFKDTVSVVYILPEVQSLAEVFFTTPKAATSASGLAVNP